MLPTHASIHTYLKTITHVRTFHQVVSYIRSSLSSDHEWGVVLLRMPTRGGSSDERSALETEAVLCTSAARFIVSPKIAKKRSLLAITITR